VKDVAQAAGKFQLTLDRARDRVIIRNHMRTRDDLETELALKDAYDFLNNKKYSPTSTDGDEDNDNDEDDEDDDEERNDQHNVPQST
jgi:hypothetical protein